MQTLDRGIVLSSLKYGDSNLIIHIYSFSLGRQSFIINGFYKKKRQVKSVTFPLTEVEFKYSANQRSGLKSLRQVNHTKVYWNTLHTNPIKSTICIFLSEVLYKVLKEEEKNELLYEFILNALLLFDQKTNSTSDFHLWFLYQLTRYLGFFPNLDYSNQVYFNLEFGKYTNTKSTFTLEKEELNLFQDLTKLNFTLESKNLFNQSQRKKLIRILLDFYKLHLFEFKEPKSLSVLQTIFE